MSKRTFNITGGWVVLLIAAAGVWLSLHRNAQDAGAGGRAAFTNKYERMVRPSREGVSDPLKKIRLTHQDVLGMKPTQWEERFQGMHRNVATEITGEIVLLAGELQSELDAGLDPQGEDAKAYTETILTLLADGAPDTPR